MNLGFENINAVTDADGKTIENAAAPSILKDVIVKTNNGDNNVFWVENSNSQNFDGISAWSTETTTIEPAKTEKDKSNPGYECRFWHCR